jgi:nucleotide-binding universal stress UspA family protein
MASRTTHVVFGYDGSAGARRAIERAGALVGGVPATVLTVCEPTEGLTGHDPADLISDAVARLTGLAKEMDDIGLELASRTATEGAGLARDAGFDAEPRTAKGKPWPAIVEVADELDADLVVVGTRGLSSVESALTGSVANGLVHHCRRPLLIVPPD